MIIPHFPLLVAILFIPCVHASDDEVLKEDNTISGFLGDRTRKHAYAPQSQGQRFLRSTFQKNAPGISGARELRKKKKSKNSSFEVIAEGDAASSTSSCISIGAELNQVVSKEVGTWTYGVTKDEELSLLDSSGDPLWTFGQKVSHLCLTVSQEDTNHAVESSKKSKMKKNKNKSRRAKSSKSQNGDPLVTPKMELFYDGQNIGELICELPLSDKESNILELSMPKVKSNDLNGNEPFAVVKLTFGGKKQEDELLAIKVQKQDPSEGIGFMSCLEIHPNCHANFPTELLVVGCSQLGDYSKGLDFFLSPESRSLDSFNEHKEEVKEWTETYLWPVVQQQLEALGQDIPNYDEFFNAFSEGYFSQAPILPDSEELLQLIRDEAQSQTDDEYYSRYLVQAFDESHNLKKYGTTNHIPARLLSTKSELSDVCIDEFLQLCISVIGLILSAISIPQSSTNKVVDILMKKDSMTGLPVFIPVFSKAIIYEKAKLADWIAQLSVGFLTSITIDSLIDTVKTVAKNLTFTTTLILLSNLAVTFTSPVVKVVSLIASVISSVIGIITSAVALKDCVECDDYDPCTDDELSPLFFCSHEPVNCPSNTVCRADGECHEIVSNEDPCDMNERPDCDDNNLCTHDMSTCNSNTNEWECSNEIKTFCPSMEECDPNDGACKSVCGPVIECDDGNLCTDDKVECDGDQWICSHEQRICPPGLSCDPTDGLCRGDNELVPCVAVIDEDDNFVGDRFDTWKTFREEYPLRPFCLLEVERSDSNYVRVPENFSSDPLAIKIEDISRDGGVASEAEDWVTLCGLQTYTSANVPWVALFIDNSSSMYEWQVVASRDKFYETLTSMGIGVKKVVNTKENWIQPFLTELVPDEYTAECETASGQEGTCLNADLCANAGNVFVPWMSGDPEPNCQIYPAEIQCCVPLFEPCISGDGSPGFCKHVDDCSSEGKVSVPWEEGDEEPSCRRYGTDIQCCV